MGETVGTKKYGEMWNIPQKTVERLCREQKIKATQDKKGSPYHIDSGTLPPDYYVRRFKKNRK